ncbi:MAG: UDP-N-acetylmuramoyl-L-alanine--D-glutamate ligase, partial [Clostridiales bacterium]|nr:UDP-N-acetylmuramoyl-L-alanine--D-glutamate ligase [Clostridiales bacterium]
MDFSGKKILVFGTGISGIAAAKLLLHRQAKVILFDGNKELDRSRVLAEFQGMPKISLYTGELPETIAAELDLVVVSPGVPTDLPLICDFKRAQIPVWGEVELAYRCSKGMLLAITGTNGKTTTTALLGEIMKNAADNVRVVGNIGIPYAGVVEGMTDETVTVAEISSFQLETVDSFCPRVSAILNITPDHLNRHHTMENYIAAKLNIAGNQSQDDYCVLNYEDEILRERAVDIRAKIIYFSSLRKLDRGLYLDGNRIMCAENGTETQIICTDELNILGRHNYENVMAAAAMAMCVGVPLETIRSTLRTFQAVEHRIEFVAEKRGVRFYNDSKGTNPDAAIKGIQAMDRPTCLSGGGYDKNSVYKDWIESFDGKVKVLVLIGQTREKIAAEAEACGFTDYVFADSLQEAVDLCYERAKIGDAVLLSPACASWGMFPNYEVRGKMFKEMVHA